MRTRFFCFTVLFLFASGVHAQEPLGIFDDHIDIGDPSIPGIADYDENTGIYEVDAVGATISDDSFTDHFHYVYKEMSGSFAIQALPIPLEDIGRGGLMLRQDSDPDSAHVSILLTGGLASGGDSTVFPVFRTLKGGGTKADDDDATAYSDAFRLERVGNSVHLYTFVRGRKSLLQTEVLPLQDPVMVGLAASAENDSALGLFEFEDVTIEELPLHVYRNIPTEDMEPGATLTPITITAQVRDGQTFSTVVNEIIPRNSTASNIQVTAGEIAQNSDGSFDWTLNDLSGEAVLTYDLTLGETDTAVWKGTFDDGERRVNYIGGDFLLPQTPEFDPPVDPFVVDPNFPTVIQAEQGFRYDEADFGLMIDPRSDNGVTAVSMNGSSSSIMDFTIEIPEDGTYYFFAYIRGEQGNSDSFHFGVDDPPAGDESSRWNINSNKRFERDWVSCEDPALNPRPFELTAGEHYIYLANRESGASIDWLAVTNNPDVTLNSIDILMRAEMNRRIQNSIVDVGAVQSPIEITVLFNTAMGIPTQSTVQETPPEGFTASNLNPPAGTTANVNTDGSITWDLSGVSESSVTLQYEVQSETDVLGPKLFSGNLVIGSDPPVDMAGDTALIVAKPLTGKQSYLFRRLSAQNLEDDDAIVTHLRTYFGLNVHEYDCTNEPGYEMPADLTGADLTYVSATVYPQYLIDMNYQTSESPIVNGEGLLHDDFTFQPDIGSGSSRGSEIEIINNTHPITQGLPLGVLPITSRSLSTGYLDNPPSGVTVLATEPGNPNRALLWVQEKGATVNNITSPGLRIGAWLMDTNAFTSLTPEGIDLMNRIFAYALGETSPTAVSDYFLHD